jgi:hypothetical protein
MAEAFLPKSARLTKSAEQSLVAYRWPGNIRELKNTLWRAAILANGSVIDVVNIRICCVEFKAQGSIGKVKHAETMSPASLEKTHPDLYWYGVHGCESLYTVMGTGCISVKRGTTADGKIEVTGTWPDGRTGIYRENKGYGGKAIGEKGEAAIGTYDGYDPLLFAAVHFFRTGVAPVSTEETLEIYAFMEAADESKRRNGAEVSIKEVMDKALAEARK